MAIFEGYPSKLMLKSLEIAQWLAAQGIVEKTGKNDGPFIEFALSRVGRVKGDAWCAALVYAVVEMAGWFIDPERDRPPLKKTGLVLAMRRDLEKFHCFFNRAEIADTNILIPGLLAIWDWGDGKGHIGFVVKGLGNGQFLTIEGNHRNKIENVTRRITQTGFKGFGVYP